MLEFIGLLATVILGVAGGHLLATFILMSLLSNELFIKRIVKHSNKFTEVLLKDMEF